MSEVLNYGLRLQKRLDDLGAEWSKGLSIPSYRDFDEMGHRSAQPNPISDQSHGKDEHACTESCLEILLENVAIYGSALVLDCHSFPAAPLPYEKDRSAPRPQICIGTDAFHTPAELAGVAARLFEAQGFSVELDTPFSGAIVPRRWYRSEPAVRSIMVEVRRDLFTDERSGAKLPGFDSLRDALQEVIRALRRTR